MNKQLLKVLIVGCGNIAGRFDMHATADQMPYTHAGAYKKDGRFSIVACIEPDNVTRKEFMGYWGVQEGYQSFFELSAEIGSFDVISICSPTARHKDDVLQALVLKPKIIFCEKPVTTSSDDTRLLLERCDEEKILLAINHTRRWDSEIELLKNSIDNECYGTLRSVVALYNKGILNNGSHLIDLLYYLLEDLSIISVSHPLRDYSNEDPTIPALLCSGSGVSIHLVAGHADDFALFELQFIFSQGILNMKEGGLSWQRRDSIESKQFAGYRVLDQGFDFLGGYQKAMVRAVDNIYHAVVFEKPLASDGRSAYQAQKFCEKIAQSNV